MAQKTLSTHAATAQAIRTTLKQAWPRVTFRVRSKSFSNGDSVHVDWTDGPTSEAVNALIRQYQEGHFDGMIDLYEYSNRRDDIPQTKFVQAQRDMSAEAQRAIVDYLNRTMYGYNLRLIEREYRGRTWLEIDPSSDAPRGNNSGWQSHDIWREFSAMSLVCPDCGAATLPGDAYCPQCGHALTQEDAA